MHEAKLTIPRCSPPFTKHLFYCGIVLDCDVPIIEALFFSQAYLARGPCYTGAGLLAAACDRIAFLYQDATRDQDVFKCGLHWIALTLCNSGVMILYNGDHLTRILAGFGDGSFFRYPARPGEFNAVLDRILLEIIELRLVQRIF